MKFNFSWKTISIEYIEISNMRTICRRFSDNHWTRTIFNEHIIQMINNLWLWKGSNHVQHKPFVSITSFIRISINFHKMFSTKQHKTINPQIPQLRTVFVAFWCAYVQCTGCTHICPYARCPMEQSMTKHMYIYVFFRVYDSNCLDSTFSTFQLCSAIYIMIMSRIKWRLFTVLTLLLLEIGMYYVHGYQLDDD